MTSRSRTIIRGEANTVTRELRADALPDELTRGLAALAGVASTARARSVSTFSRSRSSRRRGAVIVGTTALHLRGHYDGASGNERNDYSFMSSLRSIMH